MGIFISIIVGAVVSFVVMLLVLLSEGSDSMMTTAKWVVGVSTISGTILGVLAYLNPNTHPVFPIGLFFPLVAFIIAKLGRKEDEMV